MKHWRYFRPGASFLFCAALCFSTVAFAQDTTATPQASNQAATTPAQAPGTAATGQDEYPDIVAIDPFGGISTWGTVLIGLGTKLVDGGVFGGRIAYNPSSHIGLELWGAYDVANVRFIAAHCGGSEPIRCGCTPSASRTHCSAAAHMTCSCPPAGRSASARRGCRQKTT